MLKHQLDLKRFLVIQLFSLREISSDLVQHGFFILLYCLRQFNIFFHLQRKLGRNAKQRYRTRTFGFTGITRSFVASRLFFREAVSIFTAWKPFALTVVTHREKLRRGASGIFRRVYNTDHF
ncbi:hypothetical protein I308_106222 [Cryptococcus tetragattii IND107]|uniref:Uncharacterized protein n=1 Tax=Cryptococcus tetragattii IND107 TaxID=1296105 RepID=A0ABR3BKA1_9TREE